MPFADGKFVDESRHGFESVMPVCSAFVRNASLRRWRLTCSVLSPWIDEMLSILRDPTRSRENAVTSSTQVLEDQFIRRRDWWRTAFARPRRCVPAAKQADSDYFSLGVLAFIC